MTFSRRDPIETRFSDGVAVAIDLNRTSSMLTELSQRVRDTQIFLRMAAIELRRIAGRAPEVAPELQQCALQLEVEVMALAAALSKDDCAANDDPIDEVT
jgi:hypothetical protein